MILTALTLKPYLPDIPKYTYELVFDEVVATVPLSNAII